MRKRSSISVASNATLTDRRNALSIDVWPCASMHSKYTKTPEWRTILRVWVTWSNAVRRHHVLMLQRPMDYWRFSRPPGRFSTRWSSWYTRPPGQPRFPPYRVGLLFHLLYRFFFYCSLFYIDFTGTHNSTDVHAMQAYLQMLWGLCRRGRGKGSSSTP